MNSSLTFRNMNIEDIDAVLNIEHNSFATPWSRDAFYNELTNNRFAIYIVLEENQNVIGYCGAWVVIDEAHITNIAILPEFRGRKLGKALLTKLMEISKELGAKKMTLEVRKSNHVAQGLYRKLGFIDGAVRKRYYIDNQEDALVMWVNI
jgi:[ribosomal protein S18]-alanine N-acetyltransferase